jgi:hypothetical protein
MASAIGLRHELPRQMKSTLVFFGVSLGDLFGWGTVGYSI